MGKSDQVLRARWQVRHARREAETLPSLVGRILAVLAMMLASAGAGIAFVVTTAVPAAVVAADAEPASLTITAHECAAGYDPAAPGADPEVDCPAPLAGLVFTITDQTAGTTYHATSDATGAAIAAEVVGSFYAVRLDATAGHDRAFVTKCTAVMKDGSGRGESPQPPLDGGDTMYVNVTAGSDTQCDWYVVPGDGSPVATPVMAASSAASEFASLPGVQLGVSRMYVRGFDEATPVGAAVQIAFFSASILQFDTEDHARANFSTVVDGLLATPFEASVPDIMMFAPGETSITLGDDVAALRTADEVAAAIAPGQFGGLVVRQGALIYVVIGMGIAGDPTPAVGTFAASLLAREAGAGTGTLRSRGTSSGGLWDKFPPIGDPIIAGLTIVVDSDALTTGDAS